jgi:hypothetical protein
MLSSENGLWKRIILRNFYFNIEITGQTVTDFITDNTIPVNRVQGIQ